MLFRSDVATGTGIPANATVVAKDASTVTLSTSTTQAIGLGASVGFSGDATQPSYINQSEQNIQDLLWQENRDRKYDTSVYTLRGVYQRQDQDFDLTQFGLFLNNDTLFITFHYNDMIDTFGRKLMSGDVLEFPNLKDYNPLDTTLAKALPRYYVIQDAAFASEGFSQTWLPHLWRVKATPLVNAQEYQQIKIGRAHV